MALRPEVMRRAQTDLDAGRPWNAANRLQSYLAHDPLNEPARLMLGQVLLDMGEVVAAGRVLLPSERDDQAARDAIGAWLADLATLHPRKAMLVRGQGLMDEHVLDKLGPVGRARTEPVVERVRAVLEDTPESDDFEGTLGDKVALGCLGLGCAGTLVLLAAGILQVWHWLGL